MADPQDREALRDGSLLDRCAQREPRAGCLAVAEREEILVGLRAGESVSAIARMLGRSPSTISREVAGNGGRAGYSAWGDINGPARGRVGEARKLRARLCGEVAPSVALWSPDEIARRLPLDFQTTRRYG